MRRMRINKGWHMKKGKHEAGNQHGYKPAPSPEKREEVRYTPQPKPAKPKRRRRGCLVVLVTLLILLVMVIAAGFIYWESYVKPPASRNNSGANGSTVIGGYDPENPDENGTPDTDGENPDSSLEDEIKNQGQSIEIAGSERKDECFTMLVVGLDESERLTDTIIVATFNVHDKTVAVLNVPRDTLSSYNGGSIHKINSAYGSGGIERTITEIQNVIGFEIDRHVIVTYDAFKELIDEIGGIDIYVPQDMYKNTGDMIIDLKEGQQTLDGEHALMYMRYRGYANADLARIEAQQSFYQAVIEKVARPATLLKLPGLASVVMDNVETDLSVGEMIWIGVNYVSMDTETIVYNTLPNTPRYINKISYVIPNEKQILELVNAYYNPYLEEITSLKLASVPGTSGSTDPEEEETQDPVPGPEGDVLPEDPNDGDMEYPDEGDEDGDIFWIDSGGAEGTSGGFPDSDGSGTPEIE